MTWPPSPKPPPSKPHSLSLNASLSVSPTVLLVTDRGWTVEVYRKGIGPAKASWFGLLLKSIGGERECRAQ